MVPDMLFQVSMNRDNNYGNAGDKKREGDESVMTKMMMITWQDCPGKDSEQYPGNPGQVVSADALAACNANLIISGTRILFHIGLIIRQ